MKNIFNSEIFGASIISLVTLAVIFSCCYMKISNINPRHAINQMIVQVA